jgi:non-homologous end joining protein Ku
MLRYGDELRNQIHFDEVSATKLDKEMVDLAVRLIEKKWAVFDRKKFGDHFATALRELVEEKRKGHKIIAHHEERPQVISWKRSKGASVSRPWRNHRLLAAGRNTRNSQTWAFIDSPTADPCFRVRG